MKAQVNQLEAMSQTLESAGFTHHQSHAVIKSVAQAMETFAVTPAVLDSRIDKVLELFAGQNADITVMRGDIASLQVDVSALQGKVSALQEGQEEMRGDIKGLDKSMIALQKSVQRQISFYGLLMIGTAISLGIAVLTS